MSISKKFLYTVIFLMVIIAVSCNSSRSDDEMSKDGKKIEKPEPTIPPPPGEADVNVMIKDITENASNIIAGISINEVLRYGPSTPPLAPGTELNILIPKQSIPDERNKIDAGDLLSLRISFMQGVNNNNNWKFVMFIKK